MLWYSLLISCSYLPQTSSGMHDLFLKSASDTFNIQIQMSFYISLLSNPCLSLQDLTVVNGLI